MNKAFLTPLIILLFFAVMVGAFNIFYGSNNRPYRLSEFLHEVANIEFDVGLIRGLIDGQSTYPSAGGGENGSGGGTFDTWLPEDDGEFTWEDVLSFFEILFNIIVSLLDFVINLSNWIIQVVALLFNFAIGVPV